MAKDSVRFSDISNLAKPNVSVAPMILVFTSSCVTHEARNFLLSRLPFFCRDMSVFLTT